jgi:hypothetical protein
MFGNTTIGRRLAGLFLIAGLALSAAGPALATDCPTLLAGSSRTISADRSTPLIIDDAIDEWDSDVIRFRIANVAVLVIKGTGTTVAGGLYDTNGSSPIASAVIGTGGDTIVKAAAAGDYCFQADYDLDDGAYTVEIQVLEGWTFSELVDDHCTP